MKKNQETEKRPKKKKTKSKSFNREILFSTYLFVGLFVLLMGYFVYFMVFRSENVINNPYNSRQALFTERIVRGKIYSRDYEELALTTTNEDETETRKYPYGNLFAHVVGYSSQGQTGIESIGNFYMLRSNAFLGERIYKEIMGEKNIGDNIVTTLDVSLQQKAYDALGNKKGAIVVLNPENGELLSMVSKPDYDPNNISEILNSLENSEADTKTEEGSETEEDSMLYNRATQGLYPPGSTFKIITLLEYLNEGNAADSFSYSCHGKMTEGEETIRCYKGTSHGKLDLSKAFAKSCNGAFASMGLTLDMKKFQSLCSRLLFNKELPIAFTYRKSSFALDETATSGEIIQSSIGQGETLVSPMHMALLMSSIANGGTLMKPYVISQVEDYNGNVEQTFEAETYGELFTAEETAALLPYLRTVVTDGTGRELNVDNYTAYGKTGSAEYGSEKGKSHAWFVGFAEKDGQKLVVSILVEDGGSGSETAVPIAKALFDEYFGQ